MLASGPEPGVRLVHEPEGGDDGRVLATRVEVADSTLARARGLMFRRSVPADHALAFPFERVATRRLHMLFVPFAIDAVWTVRGEVRRTDRLSAWTGLGSAVADRVYELPAGTAAEITPGDGLRLQGDRADGQPARGVDVDHEVGP